MKKLLAILTLILLNIQIIVAQVEQSKETKGINELAGSWTIDLRPTPDSDEYLKDFVIEVRTENTFSGKFYGSDIKNGLINNKWEKIYFAFTTRDQSNEYFHSGYLLDHKIFGTTYCPNREFIAPWNGIKKEK